MDVRINRIRALKCIISIVAIVVYSSLMGISASSAQWTSFTYPYNFGAFNSYNYGGYPYGGTYFLQTPYSGYRVNPFNPNGPFYGTVSSPSGPSLPSGISNMLLSSNLNTALSGVELFKRYWSTSIYPQQNTWNSPSIIPYGTLWQNPASYYRPPNYFGFNPWQIQPQSYPTSSPDYENTDVTLYKDNNGETIHLVTGETLSIILEGTGPSKTGYAWRLNNDELDPNVMEREVLHYFGNDEEQWVFEAKGPGTTTIKLEYKDLPISSEIKDSFEIAVVVE